MQVGSFFIHVLMDMQNGSVVGGQLRKNNGVLTKSAQAHIRCVCSAFAEASAEDAVKKFRSTALTVPYTMMMAPENARNAPVYAGNRVRVPLGSPVKSRCYVIK